MWSDYPGFDKKIRNIFEIYSCDFLRLDTLLSLCQFYPEFLPSSIFISSIFFVIGGPEVELSKNAYELKMYKGYHSIGGRPLEFFKNYNQNLKPKYISVFSRNCWNEISFSRFYWIWGSTIIQSIAQCSTYFRTYSRYDLLDVSNDVSIIITVEWFLDDSTFQNDPFILILRTWQTTWPSKGHKWSNVGQNTLQIVWILNDLWDFLRIWGFQYFAGFEMARVSFNGPCVSSPFRPFSAIFSVFGWQCSPFVR